MSSKLVLQDLVTKKIITALQQPINPRLPLFDFKDLEYMEKKVYWLARKIYESDEASRGDSFDRVYERVRTGVFGEGVIDVVCRNAGLNTVKNDEESTKEYWWDLQVEHLKIEVKYQHISHDHLSFSHEKKAETAIQFWRNWDLMIAWKGNDDLSTFYPWMIIDHEAFNPEQQLYLPSSYRNEQGVRGRYFQDLKASGRGLSKRFR